jgi:A-factor type gamma-butyrolactone 1'-reductase (1S-forming)
MSGLLANKRCLIIGASQGIGAGVVEEFLAEGARLVIASRNLEKLEALAAPFRDRGHEIHCTPMDIAIPEQIESGVRFTLETLGGLDAAVNNAAIQSPYTPLAEMELEAFQAVLDTNLRGTFVALKAEINAMLRNGDAGGSVINISSLAGFIGFPKMARYVSSKHGITGLTKVAALDYARHNIRTNAIAPGAIMTEMLAAGTGATEQGRQLITSKIPAGRIGAPNDIAKAAAWLASDGAAYVNGVTLPVDGGYSIP